MLRRALPYNLLLVLAVLCSSVVLNAQEAEEPTYSYQSDRAFFHPADFRGITFYPSEHRVGPEVAYAAPGGISLTFNTISLVIEGVEGLDTAYYLADIQKSSKGFLAEVINPAHPSIPMRLAMTTDDEHFITEFTLRTLEQGTHTFTLPERSPGDLEQLDSLYTNRQDFHVEEYDTNMAFVFVPFLIEPDVTAESGTELLDGETSFEFLRDSVYFHAPDGSEVAFEILEIVHDQFGDDGAATTRYRIVLHVKTSGKKGKKAAIALFFDAWRDAEYVVLGPARYIPRP